ncbi:putative RNA-directed DNA polymerase from transposon BS [Trichonephila clavipes]|nr:putative RNA-directed DNA polymerase from transposon BS [Trichonephila clavipes]
MPTNSSVDRLIKRSRCLIKRAKEHVKTKEHLKGFGLVRHRRFPVQGTPGWGSKNTPVTFETLVWRNPENCSVLRSKLIAIDEGLKSILNRTDYSNISILTDSRCSIQHLQDWTRVDDLWIPSHVNVPGNEVSDFLAKRGCSEIATTDYALTYREIYSLRKIKDRQVWMAPPDHSGISRKSPVGALEFDGDRNDQKAASRLLSGHLKCMTFEPVRKVLQTCPKCRLLPAFPEHILDCLGFALEDVHASPLLVLDFVRVSGLVDLI